ncbi:hypothetical protein MSIMFI_05623 [Mycobacterium simulans]|nr:hypothetical protein MSIMFI_05623 [Mycobacterium simulans]
MNQPDTCEPPFQNPDTPPTPELKKPDDGAVVEFPNPGTAGASMSTMRTGPRVLWASSAKGISGMVTAGMVKAPVPPDRWMLSGFIAGIVRPPGKMSMGSEWAVTVASSGILSMATVGVLKGRLARNAAMVPCDELAPITIGPTVRSARIGGN